MLISFVRFSRNIPDLFDSGMRDRVNLRQTTRVRYCLKEQLCKILSYSSVNVRHVFPANFFSVSNLRGKAIVENIFVFARALSAVLLPLQIRCARTSRTPEAKNTTKIKLQIMDEEAACSLRAAFKDIKRPSIITLKTTVTRSRLS